MLYLILYILSVVIAGLGFFWLNLKYKWVDKRKLKSFDGEFITAGIVFGILLWPLGLLCVGLAAAWKWVSNNFIPE